MTRSSDIVSFSDFRSRLRDHLDQTKASGRPLFVTKNGQTEAVVLPPVIYDELMDQAELTESLSTLDRGMADVEAGRTSPAKAGLRRIADELNLKLER
jgi:PHD/YefM family antitoxin component YafN of YafNO toxin-antitoxin module